MHIMAWSQEVDSLCLSSLGGVLGVSTETYE